MPWHLQLMVASYPSIIQELKKQGRKGTEAATDWGLGDARVSVSFKGVYTDLVSCEASVWADALVA